MKEITAGYEGKDKDEKDIRRQFWRLELIEPTSIYGIMGQVLCQVSGEGVPQARGVLSFRDKEEFEWLAKKIRGERNPKAKE